MSDPQMAAKSAALSAVVNARLALKHGDRRAARRWAEQALSLDPELEEPWLILAALASPKASLAYLQRALEINPQSGRAQQGLEWAEQRLHSEAAVVRPVYPRVAPAPVHPVSSDTGLVSPVKTLPSQRIVRPYRHWNWSLILGIALILFISLIAIWGPALAMQDPVEAKAIIRYNGEWLTPPIAPGRVPGYPLGTDTSGRDVLSQLLWAVRPTLIMVTLVALIRLALGLVIGLLAGWAGGWIGRWMNISISAALAIPVLIVALAVIAAVGIDMGVWAFIFGLAASGWAETARLVRDQTLSIQRQPFIEAARALGVDRYRLLFRNILRHIRPMLAMLLAFEVSATLLTTASLGFLGYYIGGEVWTPISDTASARQTGVPELGMMLATLTTDLFVSPWKMIAAGTIIFITILGFNLLGEGLRQQLDHPSGGRQSSLALAWQRLSFWWDERISQPLSSWRKHHPRLALAATLVIVGLAVGLVWARTRADSQAQGLTLLPVPGNHLWASEAHDPYGTLQTHAISLESPQMTWNRRFPGEFNGGFVVTNDGTLFLATRNGITASIRPDGSSRWPSHVQVPDPVIGSPALSDQGRVYLVDGGGGLSAVSPAARRLWSFTPQDEVIGTSGPVTDQQGNIYYARGGHVQSLTPDGQSRWNVLVRDLPSSQAPTISPAGDLVFLVDVALRSQDGTKVALDTLGDVDQIMVGGDGLLYGRSENQIFEWQMQDGIPQVVRTIDWDAQRFVFGNPRNAGVTRDGHIWLLYYSSMEDARLVWLDMDGKVLSNVRFPHRDTRLIAIDGQSVAYVCGASRLGGAECLAVRPGSDEPVWTYHLPESDIPNVQVTGGAMIDGTLYVALKHGVLYAIGEAQP